MARPVTLAALTTAAQRRAGLVGAASVDATALANMVQQSATACYDLILEAFGEDYFMKSSSITTSAGTATVALPADFYRLLMLFYPTTGDVNGLEPIPYPEFDPSTAAWSSSSPPRYHLEADNVRFSPCPNAVYTVGIFYVPIMPAIVDGASPVPFAGINGWEEYVVWDVAGKLREEDESDSSRAFAERDLAAERIRRMAPRRDKVHPHRVRRARERKWTRRYL